MGRAGRGLRWVMVLASLALVLVACGERSNIDPDAAVSVSGRVLDADGAALSDRPVRLGSGVTISEGGFAALTVGLSCFGGGCSGDFFDTTTDENGAYRLNLTGKETQSTFGEATSFLLSTSAAPPDGRATGPAVRARFRIQTTDLAVPNLSLVDVRPELTSSGSTVTAAWGDGAAPPPYTLTFLDQTGAEVWGVSTTDPGAPIDGRVLEDGTGVAVVSTQRSDAVEGSSLDLVHHSSGVAFHGGYGPPPSRGAQCGMGSGDSITLGPCALTDGDFGPATLIPTGCVAESGPSTSAPCVADRLRVVLRDPVAADLAVVRGCGPACRVAVIGADDISVDVGPVAAPFGTVALDRREITGLEITADDFSGLTEVSVWPPVESLSPQAALMTVDDPTGVLDGGHGSDWGRTALTAVAIALVAGLFVLLGVAIGRRRGPA